MLRATMEQTEEKITAALVPNVEKYETEDFLSLRPATKLPEEELLSSHIVHALLE